MKQTTVEVLAVGNGRKCREAMTKIFSQESACSRKPTRLLSVLKEVENDSRHQERLRVGKFSKWAVKKICFAAVPYYPANRPYRAPTQSTQFVSRNLSGSFRSAANIPVGMLQRNDFKY